MMPNELKGLKRRFNVVYVQLDRIDEVLLCSGKLNYILQIFLFNKDDLP